MNSNNTPFEAQVRKAIERAEGAWIELTGLAQQAREAGDKARFWALSGPTNLGALHHLIGETSQAQTYYHQNAGYWRAYRAWSAEQGQAVAYSYDEACAYLMAKADAEARDALLNLHARVALEKQVQLAIPLICVGLEAEGRATLWKYIAHVRLTRPHAPASLHRQAEIVFWLGDVTQAQVCAAAAVGASPQGQPQTPVLALRSLFDALQNPADARLSEAARQALLASVRWFYSMGFLSQAVDAREYLRIWSEGQTADVRVRGMTMAWM